MQPQEVAWLRLHGYSTEWFFLKNLYCLEFSFCPQGFLLLSHDWYVRRSSRPPSRAYRGQINLGRSCGCCWNLLLISIIILSHCFWEKYAREMKFCTCLKTNNLTNVFAYVDLASIFTLFDLYTSSTMSVLLCLAECTCSVKRESNVAYSSNVLELLGDLVLMMAAWWAQYLLLLCKLSPTAWSSTWLQDQWLLSSECGRISSQTTCSTIIPDDCVRLLNNY